MQDEGKSEAIKSNSPDHSDSLSHGSSDESMTEPQSSTSTAQDKQSASTNDAQISLENAATVEVDIRAEKHTTFQDLAALFPPETEKPKSETEKSETAADKISAIHSSLSKIAQEEDEERVSKHIAQQVQQVKAQKEQREQAQNLNTELTESTTSQSKQHVQSKKHKKSKIDIMPKVGDSAGELARKTICLFSITVFLICIALIILYFVELYQARSVYDDLSVTYHARQPEEVEESSSVTQLSDEEDEEQTYTLLSSAEELLEINDEVVGWISIDDTEVDYPLMQHLDDTEGDEYYLYKNIYEEDSKSGSIFLDYRCSFDCVGEDGTLEIENSDNLIIYGHNMRDLSMFGSLKNYVNDEDYYEEHPIITLNSNYGTYQYKIFAYFIADAEDTTDTRFEYWNGINFEDEDEFYDYVNEVKRRTIRITNVDVEYGDSLLTLSTCNSAFDSARLVIVARLVREDEDPYERIVGSIENPNIKWPTAYYSWGEVTYDPDADFAPYG